MYYCVITQKSNVANSSQNQLKIVAVYYALGRHSTYLYLYIHSTANLQEIQLWLAVRPSLVA